MKREGDAMIVAHPLREEDTHKSRLGKNIKQLTKHKIYAGTLAAGLGVHFATVLLFFCLLAPLERPL